MAAVERYLTRFKGRWGIGLGFNHNGNYSNLRYYLVWCRVTDLETDEEYSATAPELPVYVKVRISQMRDEFLREHNRAA